MFNSNKYRLLFFDSTQGTLIGLKLLVKKFGLTKGLALGIKVKKREQTHHPFEALNKGKRLTEKELLSQQQMAPMILMYKLLLEEGYTKEETLDFCFLMAKEVASAFLDFNVPNINPDDWKDKPIQQKEKMLDTIVDRFFNVYESDNEIYGTNDDEFKMTVKGCHFADYAKELDLNDLGHVFCSADGHYFNTSQPNVEYNRSQTLMENKNTSCDFCFKMKIKK